VYRFCYTNTLSLLLKAAKFRTDGRFTTVDVQATFHIQRVAMLKLSFQAKFCIPSPKTFVAIKQEAKENFHKAVKLSLYILKKILPYTN
jgi:hypothetical protein